MNIFIAFANQDRDVRDKLLRQMNLAKDRHSWSIWSAKEIKAGEHWGDEIERRLQDSEVIILLLSTDFFNSKYIIEKELPAIVERHRQGECHIIPVIARSCHWQETPFGEYTELGEIQALPAGGKSIVSRGNWDSDDQPYFEVVQGVRDSIRAFQLRKRKSIETGNIVQNESETTDDGLAVSAFVQQEKDSHATFLNSMTDVEDEYWKGIRKLDVKEIYEKFIRENPNHPKVTEAAKRIRWKERSFILYLLFTGIAMMLVFFVLKYPSFFGVKSPNDGLTSSQRITTADRKSGLEMVAVQGGTFTMGSPKNEEGRYGDECQHPVTVRSFSIGKYEVTQADWRDIMGDNTIYFKNCDDCPMSSVSWGDIQDFLKKLNAKYPGKNYRLPTEAEWEYAARGGHAGINTYYSYSGSNDLGAVAWHGGNSGDKTHPVGTKKANQPLGLHDMSGNVWEWCQDIYKPYPCDSKNTSDGSYRVLRGGSWISGPDDCRVASRSYDYPSGGRGFRLTASPSR